MKLWYPMLLASFAIPAYSQVIKADAYPTKAIRWIVTGAPGDGSDVTGRMIAERVSQAIGQPVVIENKPGAGGVLGSELAANSPADGYTFIVGNAGSHGVNAAIYRKLRFNVVDDFAPVSLFCTTPNVLVVNQTVKAKNVQELVVYAKENAGKVFYASGGVGSSAHMVAELFKSITNTDITHVPYKGSTPAIMGVIGNESQLMIGNLPPWLEHIKSGRVRALAVSSPKRDKALPDVPTLSDTYPGLEAVAWYGLLAPKGTPPAVIATMNAAVRKALNEPALKQKLIATSCEPAASSPDELKALIGRDVTRWKKLASDKNINAD